jgi:glycosyltransferase involved in cell wall biosynthesis
LNTSVDFTRPSAERRVVITYKNFPVAHHVSHIGLGVSALNTAKVLRENGIPCDVWPILNARDLAARIENSNPRPSHVVIAAPWLPTLDLQAFLVFRYPDVQFAVTCHSNVGFLSADPTAITNFRQELDLEQGSLNFTCAGNSRRFVKFIQESYQRPCIWLPNLYYLESNAPSPRRPWCGGTVRIGSFGAVRPLKNHLSAAAASLEIAEKLHTDVQFHISVGRVEGGYTVVRAIEAMLNGSPRVTLVKDEWYHWPRFRSLIRSMHLLIQASFSETFNMVTADGAAESIPSVVSDAIDWAPSDWKAEVDSPDSIARIGRRLLHDPFAGSEGFFALQNHDAAGLLAWRHWLQA